MSKKANQIIDLGFLRGDSAGKDLSGLFAASVASESDLQQATLISIDRLLDNPYQPRLEANDESINELSGVIKSQGFQGVLMARPDPDRHGHYQITAGHRRREAARRAGLSTLPVVLRDLTDEEMVTLAITENIQREDLSPLEEGKIYILMNDEMGYTHEQIAREVGRKRGYIENRIRVARAPGDIQALIQAKPDSIRAVASLIKGEKRRGSRHHHRWFAERQANRGRPARLYRVGLRLAWGHTSQALGRGMAEPGQGQGRRSLQREGFFQGQRS